jgi:hypothetical protein
MAQGNHSGQPPGKWPVGIQGSPEIFPQSSLYRQPYHMDIDVQCLR